MDSLLALFSSEEELSSDNFSVLNDLTDELLIEILIRLPTAKSAVSFKLVCKRWCSLISTSFFVSQFTTHHNYINKNNDYHAAYQLTTHSAVFFSPIYPYQQFSDGRKLFFITGKEDPIFESPGFTLEFLPVKRELVSVVASCNDLLLCQTTKLDCVINLYICNPFTMQQLVLKPPARMGNFFITYGLVYEPDYHQRGVQGIYECRFKVICVQPTKKDSFYMHIFCSETRKWSESPLLGAEYRVSGNVVAHDRKLHWHNGKDVVAYDPFNNETFFMDVSDSQESNINNDKPLESFCLGICQGFLQVMKFVTYILLDRRGADYLCVWELKDSESRCLILKHKLVFLSRHNYLNPLGFHPNNKDVIYLSTDGEVIPFKIQNGKLEVIGEILQPKMNTHSRNVFTTTLPWWPTPVSSSYKMPMSVD